MFKMFKRVGVGEGAFVQRWFYYDFEVRSASLQYVQKNVNKTIFSIPLFLVKLVLVTNSNALGA